MLERFLKSPFIAVASLLFLGFLFISKDEGWSYTTYIVIPFLVFTFVFCGLVLYNNKRFPDKKVKLITYIPYELREEDEGMQWITFKACRKVYIFYYFAVPIGILLVSNFHNKIPHFTIGLLVIFGVIQYLIYWFEIRKII